MCFLVDGSREEEDVLAAAIQGGHVIWRRIMNGCMRSGWCKPLASAFVALGMCFALSAVATAVTTLDGYGVGCPMTGIETGTPLVKLIVSGAQDDRDVIVNGNSWLGNTYYSTFSAPTTTLVYATFQDVVGVHTVTWRLKYINLTGIDIDFPDEIDCSAPLGEAGKVFEEQTVCCEVPVPDEWPCGKYALSILVDGYVLTYEEIAVSCVCCGPPNRLKGDRMLLSSSEEATTTAKPPGKPPKPKKKPSPGPNIHPGGAFPPSVQVGPNANVNQGNEWKYELPPDTDGADYTKLSWAAPWDPVTYPGGPLGLDLALAESAQVVVGISCAFGDGSTDTVVVEEHYSLDPGYFVWPGDEEALVVPEDTIGLLVFVWFYFEDGAVEKHSLRIECSDIYGPLLEGPWGERVSLKEFYEDLREDEASDTSGAPYVGRAPTSSTPTSPPPTGSQPAEEPEPSTSSPEPRQTDPYGGLTRDMAEEIADLIVNVIFPTCCRIVELENEGEYEEAMDLRHDLIGDYERLVDILQAVEDAYTGFPAYAQVLQEATTAMEESTQAYRDAVSAWESGDRAYDRGQTNLANREWERGNSLSGTSDTLWSNALRGLDRVFLDTFGAGYLGDEYSEDLEDDLASLTWDVCPCSDEG